MKIGWAIACVLMAAGVATAQPGGGKGKAELPPFKEMDGNGDGGVSLGEFMEAHTKMLEKRFRFMDTNNDGQLSEGELETGRDKAEKRMKKKFGED